jgi:hypothetical protein
LAKGVKYRITHAATETKNKIQLSAVDFFSMWLIFCEDKGRIQMVAESHKIIHNKPEN